MTIDVLQFPGSFWPWRRIFRIQWEFPKIVMQYTDFRFEWLMKHKHRSHPKTSILWLVIAKNAPVLPEFSATKVQLDKSCKRAKNGWNHTKSIWHTIEFGQSPIIQLYSSQKNVTVLENRQTYSEVHRQTIFASDCSPQKCQRHPNDHLLTKTYCVTKKKERRME